MTMSPEAVVAMPGGGSGARPGSVEEAGADVAGAVTVIDAAGGGGSGGNGSALATVTTFAAGALGAAGALPPPRFATRFVAFVGVAVAVAVAEGVGVGAGAAPEAAPVNDSEARRTGVTNAATRQVGVRMVSGPSARPQPSCVLSSTRVA